MGGDSVLSINAAIDLLEAIHSAEADWQRWTVGVAVCAARYFTGGGALGVSTYRSTPGRIELLGLAQAGVKEADSELGAALNRAVLTLPGSDDANAALTPELQQLFGQLHPNFLDVFFRHEELLTWHSELVPRLAAGVPDFNQPFFQANGATDAVAVTGGAGEYHAGIVRMVPRRMKLSPRTRHSLLQVALHFESALRLRTQADAAVVAVIRPDGRVAHAERAAADRADLRAQLARHARLVEHSRLRRVREEPNAADAWTALIGGHWGLLERTDSDGSRYYVAIENGTEAQRYRALSRTEIEVLRLYARGISGKMVGYGLGLSGATVSAALGSAALKIGVRNRAAMIRLAAHLLGSRKVAPTTPLTQAENEVMAHLRQGLTNAQIARRRGSAERTVANQVAAILHKLQLPSRSAVAALGAVQLSV
jgi:DNA-binding CsgD family transcriptional regulator